MRRVPKIFAVAAGLSLTAGAAAAGPWELGLDAGAIFALGDRSSMSIDIPASRFRAGYFLEGGQWSIEPAFGFSVNKIEDNDAAFNYDLELGALYHFSPFIQVAEGNSNVMTIQNSGYIRPFIGLDGNSGPGDDDTEVSIGAGLGLKVPWRADLAWRFEGNLGYGFDNEAFRIGLLAGVSFFTN